jgi:hypothetical protein
MKRTIGIAAGVVAIAALTIVVFSQRSESQAQPSKLTVGIYAPTVPFASSGARLTYVQSLAKQIESKTGITTEAKSYKSFGSLKSAKPDFAIVEGQCYASNRGWPFMASAKVGGGTSRSWALYSSQGGSMTSLKGKKISYVKMGCKDTAFIENAMLESEVGMSYFGGKVGKSDIGGAVADVASYKNADGVFAPSGLGKGLTKVFSTTSVPNPAFVQMNKSLSKTIVKQVKSAVTSYGGGGKITGWSGSGGGDYKKLAGKMGKRTKKGIAAAPSPVRVEAKDVLVMPKTLDDTDLTDVDQHFEKPPERQ